MANEDLTNALQQQFNHQDVKINERETVFQGFFRMERIDLQHRLFEGGWGKPLRREIFLRDHAVAAIMYDKSQDLIGLIEQFRIGAMTNKRQPSPWLFEVVAGISDKGESPKAVMERELLEEAGLTPDKLIHICDYLSSPGGTNESLSLFCALADLSQTGGIHGLDEEGEDIRVHVIPAETVFANLYSGKFSNAATLICLQWLQLQRDSLINGTYSDCEPLN